MIVEVADEGHGIRDEDQQRIFDAYFTTKDKGRGVGLGLSIVKQIMQEHRAAISVAPRDPHGTIFTLVFPPADPTPSL